MSNPLQPIPEGAYTAATVGSLQGQTVETWKEKIRREVLGPFEATRGNVFENWIESIGRALAGDVTPGFEPIRDGQLALANRVDLLDGVRGYCSAYQSLNINSAWSLGDNRRRDLPFDAPYGPAKGAHVDAAKGGIVFDETGLWTVHCLIHTRSTAATPGPGETDASAMYVRIHQPDGTIASETVVDAYTSNSTDSITATLPFVIPEPGYYVTIGCWSSRWRWWDGGTRYTRLSVVMNDNRTINPGAPTVPDETR